MTTRLYVSNLPFDTTEHALRRHFAAHGGVLDVELAPEHKKSQRGRARVTMTSPAFAAAAVAALDRVVFEGKELRVSDSPLPVEPAPAVKVVQQFRERGNMTYELDCAGRPLTMRIYPADDERWRVEARAKDTDDAVVMTASGASRREAVEAVMRDWNGTAIAAVDTDALLRAMTEIRAI
ncbi:MAG: RNA-binding protein [Deltaproteobacteria bacterium]|nr:RNA-binding protein [Deltaproteobacteria bacterium]